jgi:uncharacterized protein YndB with AHSA1/START domain
MSQPFLYSVEREYDSSIENLWNAWVDPRALEVWYSPTQLSVLPGSVENVAEVGGIWTVAVDVPMNDMVAYFYGVYTDVVSHQRLAHTMCYTQNAQEFKDRIDAPHHDIVIDFENRGDKCWVRFSQFGVLPEGQAPLAQAGMESYFDNLGLYLAK